jgi:hypothetical protein
MGWFSVWAKARLKRASRWGERGTNKRLAQACGQKRDVEQWFGGGLCLCGNIALTISHAVGHERDSKGPKTQRWGGGQTIAQPGGARGRGEWR